MAVCDTIVFSIALSNNSSTYSDTVDDIYYTKNVHNCVVLAISWQKKVLLCERNWQSCQKLCGLLRPKNHSGDTKVIEVNTSIYAQSQISRQPVTNDR